MATVLKSSVRRRVRRGLGTLFREARRLERRRRLRYVGVIVLACGIASGGGFLIANHGESSPGSGDDPMIPPVSSLALPKAGEYFAPAAVGDRIILSGGPDGSLFPSGSTTSLSDGHVVGTCDAATVAPGTVKLGHVAHANCGDPALYGEQVLAVSYQYPRRETHQPLWPVDRRAPRPVRRGYRECHRAPGCSASRSPVSVRARLRRSQGSQRFADRLAVSRSDHRLSEGHAPYPVSGVMWPAPSITSTAHPIGSAYIRSALPGL